MDWMIPTFLVAALIIGVLLLVVIFVTRKPGKQLNQEHYQAQWLEIENKLKPDDVNAQQMAILSADKLLDKALKERGFAGQTMGDRMKNARDTWTNADHVWGAHKIRNRIAHEPDTQVNHDIARRALVAYKQALKDLGAI